jgi:hypothetical protein
MHFVDERFLQVLADGGNAAAYAYVLAASGFLCEAQGLVDAASDKVEGGATGHDQGFARMMG